MHYRIWFVFGGGCTSPGSNERWFEEIGCTPLLILFMQLTSVASLLRDFEIFLYSISLLKFASQIFWGYQWENSSCPLAYCLDRCSLCCLFFHALSLSIMRWSISCFSHTICIFFYRADDCVLSDIILYIYIFTTQIKGKIVRNVFRLFTPLTVRWLCQIFIDVSDVSFGERYSNGLSRHQNFGKIFVLKLNCS